MPSGRIRNPEDSNWPPSFKILRASTGYTSTQKFVIDTDIALGAHSPRVDERCLTYCTQTVSGRTAGRLPTCRAICVRQVFMHELAKLSGQRPRSFTSLMPLDQPAESPELDEIPLPTEGQRPGDYFAPLWPPFLLPKRRDDSMHEDRSGKPISAADALRAAGKAVEVDETDDTDYNAPRDGKPSPPKIWQPGMYVWMTRSKWHALDHMNMMMFSIRAQAGWDNYRARMRTEAEKRRALEQAQPHKTKRQAPVEATPETTPEKVVYEDVTRPRKDEFHPGMVGGRRRSGTALPTYPDVGLVSIHLVLCNRS
jgi:hypothetical protein